MSALSWLRGLGAALGGASRRRVAADHIPDATKMVPPVEAAPPPPASQVDSLPHVVIPRPVRLGQRVLRLGVTPGPDVSWVQERVGGVPVDGVFGPRTAAAVAAWQDRQVHLVADGVVGPMTWRALGVGEPAALAVFVPPLEVGDFAGMLTRALKASRALHPAAWAAVLAPEMQRAEIHTPERIAPFLANCLHETARLSRLVEVLHYTWAARLLEIWPSRFPTEADAAPFLRNGPALAERVYGGRMGNTRPGDAWAARGRGLLMTTGMENYRRLASLTRQPLELLTGEDSPLETRAGAVRSAVVYWQGIGANSLADRGEHRALRRAINGGVIGLEDVEELTEVVRGALP